MKTNQIVGIFVVVFLAFAIFIFVKPSGNEILQDVEATVYKATNCGCCEGQISVMKGEGMEINLNVVSDVEPIKDEKNIPSSMRSCHTSLIEGYFVEGHVPAEAISKLLEERPDIDGISLPGMPAGAPGMSGYKSGDFVIYSIKGGKVLGEFMRI